MKLILINCLMLLIANQIISQETPFSDTKSVGIQFGFSHYRIQDSRLSSQAKKYILPKAGFIFTKTNANRREELLISYTGNMKPLETQNLWFKIINTDVFYTYQRKSGNTWIGGYFHSSTLLNFPRNSIRNTFGNNPISYTINQGLGLAINREETLWSKNEQVISVTASSKVALLNYLIRPAYGAHPYPEHFLQEPYFNPTRRGMGASVVKSGKVSTINKYQSIQLTLGFTYFLNNNLSAKVLYAFDLQNNSSGNTSSKLANDLLLQINYNY